MMRASNFLSFFSLFLLASCATDLSNIDVVQETKTISTDENIIANTESRTLTVSKAVEQFLIPVGVGSVKLNNVQNKNIYVVSQNNTDNLIKTDKALSIASVAASGRAAVSEPEEDFEPLSKEELEEFNGFSAVTMPFCTPQDTQTTPARSASGASLSYDPGSTVHTGTTKKLFVDANSSLTLFVQKNAKVEYEGEYCYIWSIENDPILDWETAKNLADTFDRYYIEERKIFGKESDKLYIYNGSGFVLDNMANHTNTGTKVNIVVYNITSPNTVGYFYSKDYFETAEELAAAGSSYKSTNAARYSNGGKYFYINYQYASGAKNNWSDAAGNKKLALSTLVHEFQHMINYSVKNMNGIRSEDWYNEMLSMLAEDIFAQKIQTGDRAPSVMRMNTFHSNYFRSGLTQFDSIYSYGTAYAFGAWLTRNFGGISFVNMLMTDGKANKESVLDAVNSVAARRYTFDSLFNEYVQDVINARGFNLSVNQTFEDNDYLLSPIKNRPLITSVGSNISSDIGPYGFVYRKINTTSPSVTINLSERTRSETVYIIVK